MENKLEKLNSKYKSLEKEITDTISKFMDITLILEKIQEYERDNETDFDLSLSCLNELVIYGKLKNLSKIRKLLKYVFGIWRDKICFINSNTDKYVNIYYRSKDEKLRNIIQIAILNEKIELLPKSITKDGKCGIKLFTEQKYKWICDLEGGI